MAFKYLYTTILVSIFAIILIVYLFLRSSYPSEFASKERQLEYTYKKYKYVLFAIIIFLTLTWTVYQVESKHKINLNNGKKLEKLIKILGKLQDNKTRYPGLKFNDYVNKLLDDGTLTQQDEDGENEKKILNSFYFIHSNTFKPLQKLLENNEYEFLIEYLRQKQKEYNGALFKLVCDGITCSWKGFNSKDPLSGMSSLLSAMVQNDKSLDRL